MRRLRLDRRMADALLSGAMRPEDAPPEFSGAARLMEAARSQSGADLSREGETVAAMVEARAHRLPDRQGHSWFARALTPKIAFALVVAGSLTGSTGMALTGSLPGAAQDVAKTVLAKIGVTVPGHDEHAGTNPDSRGSPSVTPSPSPKPTTHGSVVSDVARSTPPGEGHGAAVSEVANPHPSPSSSVSADGERGKSADAPRRVGPHANGHPNLGRGPR